MTRARLSLTARSMWWRSYGARPLGSGAMGNSPGGNANAEEIVASATRNGRTRFIRYPGIGLVSQSGTDGRKVRGEKRPYVDREDIVDDTAHQGWFVGQEARCVLGRIARNGHGHGGNRLGRRGAAAQRALARHHAAR